MEIEKSEYEIIIWTDWDVAYQNVKKGKYKDPYDCLNDEECSKMRNFLVNYFLENRSNLYKNNQIDGKNDFPFNGSYYQNAEDGVPVIKYNNNLYPFILSMRRWGDLIADVWSRINSKKYLSIDEFWEKKEEERNIDENCYCYLDFWMSWDKI